MALVSDDKINIISDFRQVRQTFEDKILNRDASETGMSGRRKMKGDGALDGVISFDILFCRWSIGDKILFTHAFENYDSISGDISEVSVVLTNLNGAVYRSEGLQECLFQSNVGTCHSGG